MNGSSQDLVARASQGDQAAVGELIEQHMSRLEAFLRLRMGADLRGKESAADLAQSVCREVLAHADRYQYRGESHFRHWLFTTALRKLSNRARFYHAEKRDVGREVAPSPRHSRSDLVLVELLSGNTKTPSGEIVAREQAEAMEQAFLALPEHYREVIVLSRVVGLSHAEIAEKLGKTEQASRSILSRGLLALAQTLEAP